MSITIFLYSNRHHKIKKLSTLSKIEAEQILTEVWGIPIDVGGLVGLLLTLGFIFFTLRKMGKKPQDVIQYISESNSLSRFIVTCALLAVSLIAIWLTIRAAGLFFLRYLFVKNYNYSQYEILEMISYILIVNLCFSLTKSLRKATKIKDVASAAIQALLIGVIIFLPRSSSLGFLYDIGERMQGVIGFFVISASIALILISLTIFWNRIEKKQND